MFSSRRRKAASQGGVIDLQTAFHVLVSRLSRLAHSPPALSHAFWVEKTGRAALLGAFLPTECPKREGGDKQGQPLTPSPCRDTAAFNRSVESQECAHTILGRHPLSSITAIGTSDRPIGTSISRAASPSPAMSTLPKASHRMRVRVCFTDRKQDVSPRHSRTRVSPIRPIHLEVQCHTSRVSKQPNPFV